MPLEQGGRIYIIAQMYRRTNLIDVLTARTLGANGRHLNFVKRDAYAGGNL